MCTPPGLRSGQARAQVQVVDVDLPVKVGVGVEVPVGGRVGAAISDLAHSLSRLDFLADPDIGIHFVEMGVDRHHMAEEREVAVVDHHIVAVER